MSLTSVAVIVFADDPPPDDPPQPEAAKATARGTATRAREVFIGRPRRCRFGRARRGPASESACGFTDALMIEVEEVDGAPVFVRLVDPTPPTDPGVLAAAVLGAADSRVRGIKAGAVVRVNGRH